MKIRQLKTKFGNQANNQYVTEENRVSTFTSYKSKIAVFDWNTGKLEVFKDWDYSKTTLFYFKQFINEETSFTYGNKAQFEKLMKEHKDITEVL